MTTSDLRISGLPVGYGETLFTIICAEAADGFAMLNEVGRQQVAQLCVPHRGYRWPLQL